MRRLALYTLVTLVMCTAPARAVAQTTSPSPPDWQYSAFVDLGYLGDFNSPSNHLFRNRVTTPRVDELDVNMADVAVRKPASESSRWGVEATVQFGRDAENFGFSPTAPNIAGGDWLRHLGPTDLSYLAPVGTGLTVQAGIFNSFIGYDSLYAKDNFNYTRPWGADETPYLMLGVNASYGISKNLTAALLVVNSYWHLAHANNVPSIGGQLAYRTGRSHNDQGDGSVRPRPVGCGAAVLALFLRHHPRAEGRSLDGGVRVSAWLRRGRRRGPAARLVECGAVAGPLLRRRPRSPGLQSTNGVWRRTRARRL